MPSFDRRMNATDTFDTRGMDTNPAYGTQQTAGSYGSGTINTGQPMEVVDERVAQLA